jgi:hypothetical protein
LTSPCKGVGKIEFVLGPKDDIFNTLDSVISERQNQHLTKVWFSKVEIDLRSRKSMRFKLLAIKFSINNFTLNMLDCLCKNKGRLNHYFFVYAV